MNLIKTSLLSGISVLVKILTLLGLNKILAVYVGPTGFAAVGQLQNVIQLFTGVMTGTISNGVTKLTAERSGDDEYQKQVWETSGTIAIIFSIVFSILIYSFKSEISLAMLGDNKYEAAFGYFAFTLVFFVLNVFLQSILNGRREVKKYVASNIIGSLVSVSLISILTIKYGLSGAMIALATYQSVTFVSTLYICWRCKWFNIRHVIGHIYWDVLSKLGTYLIMALSSAILAPFVQILVRDHIANELGVIYSGYWEAVWRLSSAYLMVITTTLSVYYLPVLSKLTDKKELRIEIISGSKIIIPVVIFLSLSVYVLKDLIISLLFTEDFLPARTLIAWQMIGDTLKIASWLISFLMLAKAMLRVFLISQFLSHALFYYFTVLFVDSYGLVGVSYAHAANFFFYLIFVYFFVYRKVVI